MSKILNLFERFSLIPKFDEMIKNHPPSEKEILSATMKTTGIIEMWVHWEDKDLYFIDVGGARNDRQKWIHCFDGVNILFYVVALNDYCKKLVMENRNALKESIEVFGKLEESNYFEETKFILLLTKADLFDEFLIDFPISLYFPDYKGFNNALF